MVGGGVPASTEDSTSRGGGPAEGDGDGGESDEFRRGCPTPLLTMPASGIRRMGSSSTALTKRAPTSRKARQEGSMVAAGREKGDSLIAPENG